MSRKKIAAATMTLAALGLGFVGYVQVTRANNDREERDFQVGGLSFPGHRAYLANHQAGHGSAAFNWAPAQDQEYSGSAEPYIGQCYSDREDEQQARTDGHGGSGDMRPPAGSGGDHSSGGDSSRWSGNFSVWNGGFGGVGFGGGGGGGGGGDKKHHDDSSGNLPQGSSDTHDRNPQQGDTTPRGNDEPKAGDPPTNNGDQTQHSDDSPAGPGSGDPKPGEPPLANEGSDGPQTNPNPPDQNDPHDGTPPQTDQPPESHAVPEPGTLGLLALGMAAAALRRRRRS